MSKVAKQLQRSFHSPIRQLHQQRTGTFTHNNQQLSRSNNSGGSTAKSQEKNVTTNLLVIKPKQFLKQTTVAATEAEQKSKNNKDNPQSQIIEEIIANELKESYVDKQGGIESKDYQIYQNGKLNDFFHNERLENPQRVADICLVNDHYILVKMPEHQETLSTNQNKLADADKRRKEFRALKERNDNGLEETEKEKKRVYSYLRNKRGRITKIAPIHEEPEDVSDDGNKTVKTHSKLYCLKIQSCWQANELEVETYQTQTKIHKTIPNSACDQEKGMKQSSAPKATTEKAETLGAQKSRDIQTISGSLLKSSVQCQVSLRKCGSLIESHNNDNNSHTLEMIGSPQRKKCSRLESFYWLLRPFRAKYRRPKPKIQAVVYKTYFVKWTKAPDTLIHGYGVKSLRPLNVEMSVLRRCRSAIF